MIVSAASRTLALVQPPPWQKSHGQISCGLRSVEPLTVGPRVIGLPLAYILPKQKIVLSSTPCPFLRETAISSFQGGIM